MKNKNNKNLKIKIAIIAIVMSLGFMMNISQNVSAMTDVQRFNKGFKDAQNGVASIMDNITVMTSSIFTKHSMAYQNGWISGLDVRYMLKLPYYDYNTHGTVNIPGEAFQSFYYTNK